MATESVVETLDDKVGPRAFAVYDSSVYLAWLGAIGGVMMNAGSDMLPGKDTANLGGLILALAEAAQEVDERDRNRWRERMEAKA